MINQESSLFGDSLNGESSLLYTINNGARKNLFFAINEGKEAAQGMLSSIEKADLLYVCSYLLDNKCCVNLFQYIGFRKMLRISDFHPCSFWLSFSTSSHICSPNSNRLDKMLHICLQMTCCHLFHPSTHFGYQILSKYQLDQDNYQNAPMLRPVLNMKRSN